MKRLKKLAIKLELKSGQDKTAKLQTRGLSYFFAKFFLVMMVFKICSFINFYLVCKSLKARALIILLIRNQKFF